MATKVIPKDNKSKFAADVLRKNPRANATAVNQAWTKAGREGRISATLVNKLRGTMGLTGNLRAKRKKSGFALAPDRKPVPKKPAKKPRPESRAQAIQGQSSSNGRRVEQASVGAGSLVHPEVPFNALEELEADIDRLIFSVMALGGSPAIEDALRQARRLLYGTFARKLR